MTVGGYDVSYELYRYLVMNYKAQYDASVWESPDSLAAANEEIEKNTEQSLRDIFAVFSLAGDYGIDFDDEDLKSIADAAVDAEKDKYEKVSDYKDALAESYMNDSVYRFTELNKAFSDALYYAMENSGEIETDASKLRELFNSDSFIRVKQVLIVGESARKAYNNTYFTTAETHTDSEALEIAEKVRALALSGENFDSLVKEYGESLYMFNNTDGYYICRGMWEEANENAAFSLNVGEISPVIESSAGYSVFMRCEKDSAYIDVNFDSLCSDYRKAVFGLALEKRSASLEIEKTQALDSCSIAEMQ